MRTDNRAALLRGARVCLDEFGYARTRARDVAFAAGVSTAAIGYHFGTTQALLLRALMDGLEEWSALLDERLQATPTGPLREQLTANWGAALESFQGHRGVLAASFELIAQADVETELRDNLRRTVEDTRQSLASQMLGINPATEPKRAQQSGTACYAILSGLMVQWLIDPDGLPDPEALAEGLLDSLAAPKDGAGESD